VAALWIHGKSGKPAWFTSQPGIRPEETGQLILVKSEDDGHTWSEPINITDQIKNPEWFLLLDGPGMGIQMDDGTLVFPAQFKDKHQVPHATIITSKDHGITWSVGSGAKSNTTEAQVVELSDHALMLNMRDDRGTGPEGRNGTGARSVAISRDLGKSWTEHPSSRVALAEPVCMASLINHRYQGRDLLLFSNPFDQYDRQNITIRVSEDEGLSWSEKYYTLIDEGQGRGYSCMTSIDEDTIGILYESSQADLVFQRIKMADLLRER
jgi:sialidase-1